MPEGKRPRLNDDGARRPVARAPEMKARFASVGFAGRRLAPKRGVSVQAIQAPAAARASRSQALQCWRRSNSNHPRPADDVGQQEAATRRAAADAIWIGSVPASGGSPRSSRCIWPNERTICTASANSANCAPDRILDRNQFIELRRVRGRPTLTEFPDDEGCRNETQRQLPTYLPQLRRFFGRFRPPRRRRGRHSPWL